MPKFNKSIEELKTRFDKWLYVIKNLHRLDSIPNALREDVFEKLFETAAKFTREQIISYEDSLKHYRDLKNSLDTARDEKALEIAKNLLKSGISVEIVTKFTGLTKEQIGK